jgi:DNA recombination protein RmuC
MEPLTILLIIIGILVFFIIFLLWKTFGKNDSVLLIESLRKEVQEGRERDREHLQERMDNVASVLNKNMMGQTKVQQAQSEQAATILKDVTRKLTQMEGTSKQVLDFTKDLTDLQAILKQPKGRGVLGEYWLESLLNHVLQPGQFQMQYKFQNSEIVDAVVFIKKEIIPIDAKFALARFNDLAQESEPAKRASLEKEFKNDLKLRIDETAKYIRPEENTTDFAFMFLPADGVYYDLLVNQVGTTGVSSRNLMEYAFEKRVLIVSPSTFYAYLQTVTMGLNALKLNEDAQQIRKNVELLGKHITAYDTFMQKMGNNLGTTVNMYNQAFFMYQWMVSGEWCKVCYLHHSRSTIRHKKTSTTPRTSSTSRASNRCLIQLPHLGPIHNFPKGFNVIGATVLVVKVIGMFPNV